jgi:hypothetical protein
MIGCGEVVQIIHLPALYQLPDLFRVTALSDVSATVLDAVSLGRAEMGYAVPG